MSSLAWLLGGRLAGQLVTWTITLLVMRILAPEDYGLMAMAATFTGFIAMFESLGVGSALVQHQEIDRSAIKQAFGFVIAFCAMLYLSVFLGAPYIAAFFEEERLTHILRVSGTQSLLLAFSVIPDAFLSREMRFARKSAINVISVVSGSLITLLLALLGFGVWALVLGNVLAAFIRAIGLNLSVSYWCVPSFSFTRIRALIGFGMFVTIDRILWFVYSQADVVIIGKILGKEALGLYSVALQLASLPLQKIAGSLNEVGFAAFSRLPGNLEVVGQKHLAAVRPLAFVGFPVFWGISAVAPAFVSAFLGAKWEGAILPLQLLSLVMPLRLLHTVISTSLMGVGHAHLSVRNSAIATVVVPASIMLGVHWGLQGVCLAILAAYPAYFLAALTLSVASVGTRLSSYFSATWLPALAASVMYVVTSFLREQIVSITSGPIQTLLVLIVAGAATYILLSLIIQRRTVVEFMSLFQKT